MALIEIGMKRERLVRLAQEILTEFGEGTQGQTTVEFSSGDHIVTIGNEDMERDDIDEEDIYVDIS